LIDSVFLILYNFVAVVGVVPAAVTGVVAYGAYRAGAVGYVGRKVGGFVKDKIM